jgi:hypothetical protein
MAEFRLSPPAKVLSETEYSRKVTFSATFALYFDITLVADHI